MSTKIRHTLTAVAAVGAAVLAGTAIAGAASDPSGSPTGSPAGASAPAGPNEKPLTGATATKVKQAALAKVSGTVLRVETDEGGVYEAHIRKSDGTEVEIKIDKDFNVTAIEQRAGRGGPGGPGGHGGAPNEKPLTGATATEVKQAALAKVSGTVLRVETDEGGIYEAHIRKSDGSEVEVKVDKEFNVTAVEERGPRP